MLRGLLTCDPGGGAAPPLRPQGLGTKKPGWPGGLALAVKRPTRGRAVPVLVAHWLESVTCLLRARPPGTGQCRGVCPQGGRAPDFQRVRGNPVRVDGGSCASEHVAREAGPL